jgi:hypothetical protein
MYPEILGAQAVGVLIRRLTQSVDRSGEGCMEAGPIQRVAHDCCSEQGDPIWDEEDWWGGWMFMRYPRQAAVPLLSQEGAAR